MSTPKLPDASSLMGLRNDIYTLIKDRYPRLAIPDIISMLTAMVMELCVFFPDRGLAVTAIRDAFDEELRTVGTSQSEKLTSPLKTFN